MTYINFTSEAPTHPGIYLYRNNYNGYISIGETIMFVGYVNWTEDPLKGHGKRPTHFMPKILRAVRTDQALTCDSLTVEEWGGEWMPLPELPKEDE